jgi:transcription elongation factor
MTSASFHPGDMVQVVGGKYKGHSALVVVLKTKMVDIKLLPSHTQVRVMIHNVSSFSPGERQNIPKVLHYKDHISSMSLEQRNQCVLELLKIRDSIDALVSLFSDFKF